MAAFVLGIGTVATYTNAHSVKLAVAVTAGLLARSSLSVSTSDWERLWIIAWCTLPVVSIVEAQSASEEALATVRARFLEMHVVVAAAAASGLLGGMHGKLLSIPAKWRLATGLIICAELCLVFHLRGAGHLGLSLACAFASCMGLSLLWHRNQQSLAQLRAGDLATSTRAAKSASRRSGSLSSGTSSGLFPGCGASLWSGWSASWSDAGPEKSYQERLSAFLGGHRRLLSHDLPLRAAMQAMIRQAKLHLAQREAGKAKRRAAHRGKAYGQLVWLRLRRAQRDRAHHVSLIPRYCLRKIVIVVIADETARLDDLYSQRLAAGATSYRGSHG